MRRRQGEEPRQVQAEAGLQVHQGLQASVRQEWQVLQQCVPGQMRWCQGRISGQMLCQVLHLHGSISASLRGRRQDILQLLPGCLREGPGRLRRRMHASLSVRKGPLAWAAQPDVRRQLYGQMHRRYQVGPQEILEIKASVSQTPHSLPPQGLQLAIRSQADSWNDLQPHREHAAASRDTGKDESAMHLLRQQWRWHLPRL